MGRRLKKHSGHIEALNIVSGKVDITTDGNGDGSTAVTFPNVMNGVPSIVCTIAEADITGNITTASQTVSGFTCVVDGSAVTSGTLTVHWVAVDQTK